MKVLVLVFTILIIHDLCAQKTFFVRIYDLKGKKIYRGHVASVTDTSLQLRGKDHSIPVSTIGSIRTKHSAGNNILIGALIGTTSMTIVGVASVDPDALAPSTTGEGAAVGVVVGVPLGCLIGALTIPFKNSKNYLINGDAEKWKAFRSTIPGKRTEPTSGPN